MGNLFSDELDTNTSSPTPSPKRRPYPNHTPNSSRKVTTPISISDLPAHASLPDSGIISIPSSSLPSSHSLPAISSILPATKNLSGREESDHLPGFSFQYTSHCEFVTDSHCCICLNDYRPEAIIHMLSCDHVFHRKCIAEWLQCHHRCPLCRRHIGHLG